MVNDLGVDPDEWFRESIPLNEHPPNTSNYESGLPKNPLDSMPIATNKYHPDKKMADWYDNAPSEYEPPDDWFVEKPDESDVIEEEKTMHQKMYEIATAKYNPFAVGGSESLNSMGGSENHVK
jgi:hypothetical protein